jgi:2-polyprenyl-3-methyl-5-hydroxy-6-metoxy-1,4-benzoquinol methylase
MSRREVVDRLMETYGVGEHFARAYLDYWQEARGRAFASLEEIQAQPDPHPMWFHYAMSTNLRADEFLALLEPHLPRSAKRYLDVGCGFGGNLCAFAGRGLEVAGIEIDPVRIGLSRANVRDRGLTDCVLDVSILEEGLPERLGLFDVITCIDVIEHVADARPALENLAGLLNPEGVLFLEIPNMDSLAFVASDGHFNLFGITQLERDDAVEVHEAFFSFEYDVGSYHPLDFYLEALDGLGLSCSVMDRKSGAARLKRRLSLALLHFARGWIRYRSRQRRRLSPPLRAKVRRRVAGYLKELLRHRLRCALGKGSSAAFRQRFLTDFWWVLARRGTTDR